MPCIPAVLVRIAFTAGMLLLPASAYAEGPPAPAPSAGGGSAATAWTAEPASVRSAVLALLDACANWPKEPPVSPQADLALLKRGTPVDALLCDTVVDPDGNRVSMMILAILVAAMACGAFTAGFTTVTLLLRLSCTGLWKAVQGVSRR